MLVHTLICTCPPSENDDYCEIRDFQEHFSNVAKPQPSYGVFGGRCQLVAKPAHPNTASIVEYKRKAVLVGGGLKLSVHMSMVLVASQQATANHALRQHGVLFSRSRHTHTDELIMWGYAASRVVVDPDACG